MRKYLLSARTEELRVITHYEGLMRSKVYGSLARRYRLSILPSYTPYRRSEAWTFPNRNLRKSRGANLVPSIDRPVRIEKLLG